jgi:hypothetical protein
MSFVAVAIGGAALVGGGLAYAASQNAAHSQAAAAAASDETQMAMFQQQRADQAPWRQAGSQALAQMQDPKYKQNFTMADFQADPGYAFRMQQGQQAIERSALARGGSFSGATMKSLSDYGQNAASAEYQNAYDRFNNDRSLTFNRLASVAGTGQTANGQVAQGGMNAANNISQGQQAAGNAAAAGAVGGANAIANGLNQGTNTWMSYQMMNRFAPGGGGGSGGVDMSSLPTLSNNTSYLGHLGD